MARTYSVTVTVVLNDGAQLQNNYFNLLTGDSLLGIEGEVTELVRDHLAKAWSNAQWFIVIVAGSDYGFMVYKYNGDGTFANELVDR